MRQPIGDEGDWWSSVDGSPPPMSDLLGGCRWVDMPGWGALVLLANEMERLVRGARSPFVLFCGVTISYIIQGTFFCLWARGGRFQRPVRSQGCEGKLGGLEGAALSAAGGRRTPFG